MIKVQEKIIINFIMTMLLGYESWQHLHRSSNNNANEIHNDDPDKINKLTKKHKNENLHKIDEPTKKPKNKEPD